MYMYMYIKGKAHLADVPAGSAQCLRGSCVLIQTNHALNRQTCSCLCDMQFFFSRTLPVATVTVDILATGPVNLTSK